MTQTPSQILAVCTGNICRSPTIERLLAMRLAACGDTHCRVASAGTGAVTGAPIDATMAELLRQAGASTSGFAARPVTIDLVNQAQLILTATTEHRSTIVRLAPGALRRTFTLLEFSNSLARLDPTQLAPLSGAERLARLIDNARQSRPALRASGAPVDILDPYRQASEVYQAVFTTITRAVEPIAAALGAGA